MADSKAEAIKQLLKLIVPHPEALEGKEILCAWCGRKEHEILKQLANINNSRELELTIKEFSISSLCVVCQEEMFKEEEE